MTAGRERLVGPQTVLTIEAAPGWRSLGLPEVYEYRDLLYFLVWRGIKARYAQSALGVGWAIIQPVFMMVVFTVIFGFMVKMESDGAPYAVFSFAALVPWTYFSNALTGATESLVGNANMLTKVYFPRLVLPLSAVLARLLDFMIALALLGLLMIWFGQRPNAGALMLPVLVLIAAAGAMGLGTWLAAMAVQYRDVKHALSFGAQLLMYLAPVVYPMTLVPDQFRYLYALNPMVGVIEGFRSGLLGTTPMPWDLIAISSAGAVLLLVTGMIYFRRMERVFADVA